MLQAFIITLGIFVFFVGGAWLENWRHHKNRKK